MKALFDPLVLKSVMLATPAEIFANGRKFDEYKKKKMRSIVPSRRSSELKYKLFEERVALLTADVQAIVRKPENTAHPRRAEDFRRLLPGAAHRPLQNQAHHAEGGDRRVRCALAEQRKLGRVPTLPAYWTVEEDKARLKEQSYVLTTGDPKRPEKDKPVSPGFPFQPPSVDFRDGRREAFVDWLTAPANPLSARVAVNRIWGWHFGEGLHRASSDFGLARRQALNQKLLDWLAAEFVTHDYSMKWLHRRS
jgi:hypothetical protein